MLHEFLVILEKVLEHEQKGEDLVFAGARDQDLGVGLQDCLLHFCL